MIKLKCRTNLDDVMQYEKFPTELPSVPRVGDKIRSAKVWPHKVQIELEVCGVTWVEWTLSDGYGKEWRPEIGLYIPKSRGWSVAYWKNWYDYIRGEISQEIYEIREQSYRTENRGFQQ